MLYISKRICNISLKEYAIYIPVFHMWIKKKGFIWIQSCVSSPPQRFTFGLRVFFPLTNEIIYNSYNFAQRNFHYQLLHIYTSNIIVYRCESKEFRNYSQYIRLLSSFIQKLFHSGKIFFSIKGIQLYCFVLNICTRKYGKDYIEMNRGELT